MQLAERRSGLSILDLAGKLTLGGERPDRVQGKIRELVGRGERVLLNLGNVTVIDSSGLGELVACNTSAWHALARAPRPDVAVGIFSC